MPILPQTIANQRNAQLSTGPITLVGKTISSLNATKHGIFAKDLLKAEDEEGIQNYQELKEGLYESLRPRNAFEATLVDKICVALFRLRKVLRFESIKVPHLCL